MKHILVIDDNEDVRKIIGYDLLKAGFAVDDAEDGTNGFALACQRTYDLIIIDWMMPGMNGLALTRALRARNIRSVLFMLTAKDGDNDLEEAFAAGVDDYLRKPFSPGSCRSASASICRAGPSASQRTKRSCTIGTLRSMNAAAASSSPRQRSPSPARNSISWIISCGIRKRCFPAMRSSMRCGALIMTGTRGSSMCMRPSCAAS